MSYKLFWTNSITTCLEKNSIGIKSVQIIRIEGSKFIFDCEALQNIVNQNEECSDLPVCVIIINGALRTGKSFFSNFIIRHMRKLENERNGHVDNDEMLKDYFTSRRGSDIQTIGVWVLNKVFVHDGKAIILMDTQGIFDQELNQAMTIALISLSTIVSSYQIYNLDKRIQEDHLCNMAYFSAYSSLISNKDNSKIGQTLCLLVRDWQNYENNFDLDKCLTEAEAYKHDFLCDTSTLDNTKKETRNKIFNTYDDVVLRLCPHPGHLVTENRFSGKLSDVRDDFKLHVEDIINRMLDAIEPKKISNHQTLLCREFPNYLEQYLVLYKNVESSLPEAMTILETTEKIAQDNARTKTVYRYKEKMMRRMKSRSMNREDIVVWHKECVRDAQKYFNKLYVLGKKEDIKQVQAEIMSDIDREYEQFVMMAREKNFLHVIFNTGLELLKQFSIDFDMLGEMFIKNACLALGIVYMFTVFMPFGGELVAAIIRYIVCILGGMYLVLYLKKTNDDMDQYADKVKID